LRPPFFCASHLVRRLLGMLFPTHPSQARCDHKGRQMDVRGHGLVDGVGGCVVARSGMRVCVIPSNVAANAGCAILHGHLAGQHGGSASMQDPVASMHGDVASVQGPVASVHSDVASMQSPVASVHCDVASVQDPVASMHLVMADTTNFVASLRRDRPWHRRHVAMRVTPRSPCPAPFAEEEPAIGPAVSAGSSAARARNDERPA